MHATLALAGWITLAPVLGHEGPSPRDSVPGEGAAPAAVSSGSVPWWEVVTPAATSVTEAVRAAGSWGVLKVVTVSVEPALPGGLSVRVELAGKRGHDGTAFPSVQGLSSLDAADFGGVGEAWVEWSAGGPDGPGSGSGWFDGFRMKAGRVDANSEFAASAAAAAFANPSFGLSPVLGVLPSYPAPAPSANVFVPGPAGADLGAGLYRAGRGWTAVGQVTGALPGASSVRWSAGWAAPLGDKAGDPGGTGGGWLVLERPAPHAASPFLVLASSGDGVLRHLAWGVTHAPRGVPLDPVLGVATSVLLDRETGEETVVEAFVSARPVAWLVVQPDLQVRWAPDGETDLAGLLRVALEW